MQNHARPITVGIQASLIAVVALFSTNTDAAGAVSMESWTTTNHLDSSASTITASNSLVGPTGFTANTVSMGSAYSPDGHWFTFMNHFNGYDVSVSVSGDGNFAPGFTVWASGAQEFDGGTAFALGVEQSDAGIDTPVSFNATQKMGHDGTMWMAHSSFTKGTIFGQGNILETLGYAITTPGIEYKAKGKNSAGWNEPIKSGVHDQSITDTFESGVTGFISGNSATLEFNDLAAGWYTVYIGGTNVTSIGGDYDLVVSAVPEAETWAMLLAGLGLIGWRLRKQTPARSELNTHLIPA